jgi:hypothetical protein
VSGAAQPHPAPVGTRSATPPSASSGEAVFVRAVDLPTASLAKARDAVELQLDILSPLPADAVVASVAMLGPVDGGLTRFAVGFARLGMFDSYAAAGGSGPAAIRLTGRLDGEAIEFRFDNPNRTHARAQRDHSRLVLMASAAAALAMLAGAASLRLGGDIDAAQLRLDAADAAVQRSSRLDAAQNAAKTAWTTAGAAHNGRLIGCAFTALVNGAGGQVYLTDFTIDNGVATATLSRPLDPAAVRRTQLDGAHCR